MPASALIQVTGAKELRKALRGFETDTNWRPAFRNAYGNIAESVASACQSAAGVTRLGSAGTASIVGKATATKAQIKAFSGIPYGAGFNFGTTGKYKQFPPKATPDYFIYATIEKKRDELNDMVLEQIDAALSSAGL